MLCKDTFVMLWGRIHLSKSGTCYLLLQADDSRSSRAKSNMAVADGCGGTAWTGEYLAGKYISEMEPGGAEKWVLERPRSAKWYETTRMAVACDNSGFLAVSLRKHEEAAELPTGEIFLRRRDLQTGRRGQRHKIYTRVFYNLSYPTMRSL